MCRFCVGGRYAAFYACVDTPDNGDPCGYWRVQPGQRPELVALQLSVPGPFGPGRPGRSIAPGSPGRMAPVGEGVQAG